MTTGGEARSVKPFQLFIPKDKCMDLPDRPPLKRMERHGAISGKGDYKHVSGLEESYRFIDVKSRALIEMRK